MINPQFINGSTCYQFYQSMRMPHFDIHNTLTYILPSVYGIVAFVLEYRLINTILTCFLTFSNAHINPYLIWCSFLCIQPCVLTCMLTVSLTHIRTLFLKLLKAFILTVSVTHIRAAWHVFLTAFSGIYSYNDPDLHSDIDISCWHSFWQLAEFRPDSVCDSSVHTDSERCLASRNYRDFRKAAIDLTSRMTRIESVNGKGYL